MDPKLTRDDWPNPDLEDKEPALRLARLWMKTNPDIDLLGAFRFSAFRFCGATGLEAIWAERAFEDFAELFVRDGSWVWVRHWIRDQIGVGTALVGRDGVPNRMVNGFVKTWCLLPEKIRVAVLAQYPELTGFFGSLSWHEALRKPSRSPSESAVDDGSPRGQEALPKPSISPAEALGKPLMANPSAIPGTGLAAVDYAVDYAVPISPSKGLAMPLATPYGGVRAGAAARAGVLSVGECEGGHGSEVPSREAVLEFSRGWPGEMATGVPAGIPEGWVRKWCIWRMGEAAPPFPRDWKRDLVDRFVADWVEKRPNTRQPAGDSGVGEANRAGNVAELEAALKTEKNAGERARLRARLKVLEGK